MYLGILNYHDDTKRIDLCEKKQPNQNKLMFQIVIISSLHIYRMSNMHNTNKYL